MNQKEISTVSVWDNEERYYLRERIALAVYESVKEGTLHIEAFGGECDTIYNWIIGNPVPTVGERPKKVVLKGKRKYAKKSKYWAKKK